MLRVVFFFLKILFTLNTRRKVGNAYSFPDKQIRGIYMTLSRSEINENDSTVNTEKCPIGKI